MIVGGVMRPNPKNGDLGAAVYPTMRMGWTTNAETRKIEEYPDLMWT